MEEGRDPTRAPAKCIVEGAETYGCQGKGSNLGSGHTDIGTALVRPPIQPAGVELCHQQQPGHKEPSSVPSGTLQPPEPHKGPGTRRRSIGRGVFRPQTPGKWFSSEGRGSTTYTSTSAAGFGPHHLLSGQGEGLKREPFQGLRETLTRYLQWCPTWSSFQGFFFH